MVAAMPLFTIGHSTRSIGGFVDLLRCGSVELVIDVRTVPRSRRNPQYNEENIGDELGHFAVSYARIAALGGLRSRARDIPAPVNGLWQNQSFHNYADYALSDGFSEGIRDLLDISSGNRCAIMCAEALWWQCHRRIIADYVIAAGRAVYHLMGKDRLVPAQLTPGAKISGLKVTYPAETG